MSILCSQTSSQSPFQPCSSLSGSGPLQAVSFGDSTGPLDPFLIVLLHYWHMCFSAFHLTFSFITWGQQCSYFTGMKWGKSGEGPGMVLGTPLVDDKRCLFSLPPSSLPSLHFLPSALLFLFPPPKHSACMYFSHLRLLSGQRFVITAAWCIMSVANLFLLIFLVKCCWCRMNISNHSEANKWDGKPARNRAGSGGVSIFKNTVSLS